MRRPERAIPIEGHRLTIAASGRAAIPTVAATALLLWVGMAVCRAIIVAKATEGEYVIRLLSGFASSFSDLVLSTAIAAVFAGLFLILPMNRKFRWPAWVVFWAVIAVAMIWSMANIDIVRILGEPVTLQWLSYAGFLQNENVIAGVTESINYPSIGMALAAAAAIIWLGALLARASEFPITQRRRLILVLVLALSSAGIWQWSQRKDVDAEKLLNPVGYFLASLAANMHPSIFTMAIPNGAGAGLAANDGIPNGLTNAFGRSSPIKNVLVYVFESVPAEFVETYGSPYPVTPTLKRFEKSSLRFENFYAHIPATNRSLFSLLSARYEDVAYDSTIRELPRLPLTTIADVFSQAGFRSGSFWGSDTRFDSLDAFLANRGFDVIDDPQTRSCDLPIFRNSSETYRYMDFTSDLCTAKSAIDWIKKDASKPFFALVMNAMTHYPYFTEGTTERYTDDESHNRFLNALKIGDAALGKIMAALEESGQLESTLVVVTADHGEAFGRHQNLIHAGEIYEENVHIPLILINPNLFKGEVAKVIGGMSDLAPTIAEIAGLAPAPDWRGYSLFAPERPSRTFFYSPFRGYRFGYREAGHKTIFNARSGVFEIYDLASDPAEQVNIAEGWPVPSETMLGHLAAWVQGQKTLFAGLRTKHKERGDKCELDDLTVIASGTAFQGPPEIAVAIDGVEIGRAAVQAAKTGGTGSGKAFAGLPSQFSEASTHHFPIQLQTAPGTIEVRFVNDLWESQELDRNLSVQAVKLNGINLPMKQFFISAEDAGWAEADGSISLYKNASVVSKGPFTMACR